MPVGHHIVVFGGRSGQDAGILAGCLTYLAEHALDWHLQVSPSCLRCGEEVDGAIGFCHRPVTDLLKRRPNLPTVVIGGPVPPAASRAGAVITDDDSIGRLAVDFAQGSAALVLIGSDQERGNRFAPARERALQRGLPVCQYERRQRDFTDPNGKRRDLLAWLRVQPQPLLAFCVQDKEARWLLDHCYDAGLRVPEDIAVLGVDDDVWLCERRLPTLSSIHIPWRVVGYQAALLLHRLLCGAQPTTVRVPPLRVTQRQSTRSPAFDDPLVAAAQHHLAAHITACPRLGDLSAHFGCTRQTIHRRFRAATGHTTETWWLEYRLQHACRLLQQRPDNLIAIARAAGFSGPDALRQAFVRRFGIAPSAWRRL